LSILDRLAGRLGLVTGTAFAQGASAATPASVGAPVLAPVPDVALPDMDFVVIDVETACGRSSSICQIGIVGFAGGQEVLAWETLVDPQDAFAEFNTRLHGIGARHVRGKPRFPQLYGALSAHLGGRITVAHSNFDQGAVSAACRVAGLPMIRSRWLDSVQVARHAWPELPSHRLNLLADHLGLEHRHHDALSDARVAGWVLVKASEHTGIDLHGWMAAPWRGAPRRRGPRSPAPEAAGSGPLFGLRVAILGQPRDGPLAQMIAAAGGRVVTSVGARTDLLAVGGNRPFDQGLERSAIYRRAETMIALGQAIRIVGERELSALIVDGMALEPT
jgi:DNA polymerase-3 subunit epsilon